MSRAKKEFALYEMHRSVFAYSAIPNPSFHGEQLTAFWQVVLLNTLGSLKDKAICIPGLLMTEQFNSIQFNSF